MGIGSAPRLRNRWRAILVGDNLNNQRSLVKRLDFRNLSQIINNPLEQVNSAIAMLVFSTPQPDLKLHRITLIQPLHGPFNPNRVIRVPHIGPELDFFKGSLGTLSLAFFLLI